MALYFNHQQAGVPESGEIAASGAYFNNADRHYYVDYLTPNYATLFGNSPSSLPLFAAQRH